MVGVGVGVEVGVAAVEAERELRVEPGEGSRVPDVTALPPTPTAASLPPEITKLQITRGETAFKIRKN